MSETIKIKGVSKGIAIGKVYVYIPYTPDLSIKESSVSLDEEFAIYLEYKRKAKLELDQVVASFPIELDDKADIFRAHLEILNDSALDSTVKSNLESLKLDARSSTIKAFDFFYDLLSAVDDTTIRGRANDIQDVRNRVLRISDNKIEANLGHLKENVIVVCNNLLPSDTATLDKDHVLGLITEVGGPTSHSAILARSYGIPAILGLQDATNKLKDSKEIVLNALDGEIIINPDPKQKEKASEALKKFQAKVLDNKLYASVEPITKDGTKIEVCINIGDVSDDSLKDTDNVNGVGLFRTEFIFMDQTSMPTENEQFEIYKRVLERDPNKSIIIRTLDIGGDKTLPYLPLDKEENPFLGLRAIRLCFEHPDIFETQVKALLRASVYGNLWIMVPMVSSIDEIQHFTSIINNIKKDLQDKGIAVGTYKLGVMIEIPSLCLIADEIVKIVDFASFGTNDLCQYLLAVDRMNSKLDSYYQNMHPSMFRIMKIAIDAFNKKGKPISVCGELGGNALAAPILIGLGMKKLSMNRNSVGQIKKIITSLEINDFKKIAKKVLKLSTEKAIVTYLNKELKSFI